ncbi:MAG: hypothetical protein ABL921_09595 [Pirellula sp.]
MTQDQSSRTTDLSVDQRPEQTLYWGLVCLFSLLQTGCQILKPAPILTVRNNIPTDLIAEGDPQQEVGKPRPIIDVVGWVVGVPSKLIFWNRKVENHNVSPETQAVLEEYLAINALNDVKVRVNQYRPGDDWRRLTRNTSIAWPWRYTFGAVTTLGETVFPGRIFGGDHYNPYTATIHLYSDLPSIALHEAAHAKDFSNRKYPGNYAAVYALPFVPLWHERVATNDVLSYVQYKNDSALRREAYHILYPAYGTYVGNSAGYAFSKYSYPVYLGGVVAGHAIGRRKANAEH